MTWKHVGRGEKKKKCERERDQMTLIFTLQRTKLTKNMNI